MMNIQWQRKNSFWRGLLIPVILFLCLFFFIYIGVGQMSASADEQSLKILKDAVQRATVQCYAIEGMYPPNVQYLEENYGLVYDHEEYIVHYEAFASNILPDITVIDLKQNDLNVR
ncbi:MAG: hypothetical protein ACOX7H_06055 [Bacillota bacterium]|jgi:hypothetical protein